MDGFKILLAISLLALSWSFAQSQDCTPENFATVKPLVVSYVGGEDVYVSGPCFKETDDVVLKIEQWTPTEVKCSYVDETKCLCRLSYLDVIGKINVKLVVNGGEGVKGVLISQSVPSTQSLSGLETYYVYNNISRDITLRWAAFVDLPADSKVELLHVWIDNDKLETKWEIIKTLSADSTTTVINLKDVNIQFYDKFDVRATKSFIVVASKSPAGAGLEVNKWLKIATLVVLDKMEMAAQGCKNWHAKEPAVDEYVNNLPACWPRVPLKANGNFVENFADFVKDPSCNPYGGSCWYHPGAKGCFRSMKTYKGTGQQCCYGDNGVLLVGPPGGSTFDLGHSIYKNLGHFYEDVVSYFICCIESDNCKLYYDKRPSEASNWKPQVFGGVTGDPHFITFDNVKYTFNGHGEFTLLHVLDEKNQVSQIVQIRMLPLDNDGAETKGTVLKAIAIKNRDPLSDHIQVELKNGRDVLHLDGIEYDFDEVKVEYITVTDANIVALEGKTGYLIQLSNEINIELKMTPDKSAFLLAVRIPQWLSGKTRGLLGWYDGSDLNEFHLPDGTVLGLDANDDRVVYEQFGTQWKTTPATSIFKYAAGEDHASFEKPAYTPAFVVDGVTFADTALEAQAKELCGISDRQCLFDVAMTGSLEVGGLTRTLAAAQTEHQKLNELNAKTCTPLSILFDNGVIERNLLFANESGSAYQYTFKCNKDFCLDLKYDKVQCSLGVYDKAPPKCTECNGSARVGASTLSLALVVIVALFIQPFSA